MRSSILEKPPDSSDAFTMLMYSGLKTFGIAHQGVGELLAALDVLLHLDEHLS